MTTIKKSNVISIGDHIYPLDKTIHTKLDWTKVVQDKAYFVVHWIDDLSSG
jgi:hypothetical protein